MRGKVNCNQMSFEDFIDAMEYIVKQVVGYDKDTKLDVMRYHIDSIIAQLPD